MRRPGWDDSPLNPLPLQMIGGRGIPFAEIQGAIGPEERIANLFGINVSLFLSEGIATQSLRDLDY